jgi:hypothetical protein
MHTALRLLCGWVQKDKIFNFEQHALLSANNEQFCARRLNCNSYNYSDMEVATGWPSCDVFEVLLLLAQYREKPANSGNW